MRALQVGGITPLSTLDYPGELAAVVFCQGCPWRCRYCHNPHLLSRQTEPAIVWSDVRELLTRRRGLLDAVVFSGGEPTLQHGLGDAIAEVGGLGFKVGLHTAGCYPRRLAELLPRVDWVGLDIKALPDAYPQTTGVPGSGARAWQSLRLLVASGVAHEVRVTAHRALLPADGLERLVDRLYAEGAQRVMLQGCRSERMLDPTLGGNAPVWADGARRPVTHNPRSNLGSG